MRWILPSNTLWVKDARSQTAGGRSQEQEAGADGRSVFIVHLSFDRFDSYHFPLQSMADSVVSATRRSESDKRIGQLDLHSCTSLTHICCCGPLFRVHSCDFVDRS